MLELFGISALLILFRLVLLWIQSKCFTGLSDHYYHLGLIKGIKENNHRFVKCHPNVIEEKNFAYPQLFHWLCSFFPEKVITRSSHIIAWTFESTTILIFTFFGYLVLKKSEFSIPVSLTLINAGILFILTPFHYAGWNARNVGVSGRSFGVLCGHIYVYLLYFLWFDGSIVLDISLVILIIIIINSSQFTLQFVLFSFIPVSIGFGTLRIVADLAIAIGIFHLINPSFSKSFWTGQFTHKKVFQKYYVKPFVLSSRFSIWRDLVYDIPMMVKKYSLMNMAIYALYNPFLYIFLGIPVLGFVLMNLIADNESTAVILALKPEMVLISTCLLLFVFFSFRLTRFLGEPERYLEFVIPIVAIVGVSFLFNPNQEYPHLWVAFLVIYSVVLIFIQLWYVQRKGKIQMANKSLLGIEDLFRATLDQFRTEKRIMSNNWHLLRRFYGSPHRTLTPAIYNLHTGKYHLEDFFKKSMTEIDLEILPDLIEDFNIDLLVLLYNGEVEKNLKRYKELYKEVYSSEFGMILSCRPLHSHPE